MKPVDWDCIDRLVMQQISDKVAVQDDLQTLSHSHSVQIKEIEQFQNELRDKAQ